MNLNIGTTADGKTFTLPADLGDKKIAVLAQSKKGKTYGLGCILEELAKAHRPFIATDPANNFWGLRVRPDGRPSGLEVVVIGGDHADIPFEKDQGERMAELLLATPICAVIDVAFESLGSVRRFMTDFAGRLMQTKPEIPRVIVLEEAPVLIPQKARGPQMEMCKSAVSKLATIGGNFGYGVIPASQRAATLDKDVLSQCEGLIVMGMTHGPDRKTVKEWMDAKDIGERAASAFAELGSLKPGEAWYWNPGDEIFTRFTFRERETLHPREMQKLGLKANAIQLGDMQAFVEKVKRELSKTRATVVVHADQVPKSRAGKKAFGQMVDAAKKYVADNGELETLRLTKTNLERQIENYKAEISQQKGLRQRAEARLDVVRKFLHPQYEALSKLFTELGTTDGPAGAVDRGPYELLLAKARERGCGRMLEILLDRPALSKNQLGILAGVPAAKSTFRAYMAWLKKAGLVEVEGDTVRLRAV